MLKLNIDLHIKFTSSRADCDGGTTDCTLEGNVTSVLKLGLDQSHS